MNINKKKLKIINIIKTLEKRLKYAFKYYLRDISNYILVGSLSGIAILWMLVLFTELKFKAVGLYEYGIAVMGGMALGVCLKFMMVFVVEMVMRANAASASLNAKRAQTLGVRLKNETKTKVNETVIQHAKDIIFQMHGEEEMSQLDCFFLNKMDVITEDAYFKIDRHLNYLTDRAVHGDITALKRLYRLYRRSSQERIEEIEGLLDRIINQPKEVEKLKDKVDSVYDQWKFRHYARGYVGD